MKNQQSKKNIYWTSNFFALVFMAGLLGCKYTDSVPENNPIDTDIVIEPREILNGGSKNITLFAQTKKIFPCSNYSIHAYTEINEKEFDVTYAGVGVLNICLTALGPATRSVDFGNLSNGDYRIELNNAELKNTGFLSVNESEIKLSFSQLKGIEISRTILKRVPTQTYWGTIGYHQETSIILVNQFIQKLTDKGAVFSKQSSGDYWYFKINQDGNILDPENHGYYFIKTIIFKYSANEEELRNLIKTGDGINKSELSINITSFKGDQFNNWSD